MKRKADSDTLEEHTEYKGKIKRKSLRKKRPSSGEIQSSGSKASLEPPSVVLSCDAVLAVDDNARDGIVDVTADDVVDNKRSALKPPTIRPRSSSITTSTTFFPSKINSLLEEEPRSPLPPPPPLSATLDSNTATLPLPPPILGRGYTVSVALPGSICNNAQSPELRTYLAGQIARALAIFNVDEIVVFNDNPGTKVKGSAFEGVTKRTNPNIVMARVLQYLETPQYLRKALFPVHSDLKYAGLLNPLDCPHHMRAAEQVPFREGVVLKRPVKKGKGSYADCGIIAKEVQIDKELTPGTRVTVRMESYGEHGKRYTGKAVSPDTPRVELGLYWGYRVRLADCFSSALTESSYKQGYDLTIGTSDNGDSVDKIQIRHFRHAIIFLGGLQGLESVIEADESLQATEPRNIFDYYINTCPNQGSRTIRTEEALMITLSSLRQQLRDNGMNFT